MRLPFLLVSRMSLNCNKSISELRPYQRTSVKFALENSNPLIVAPTGSGKSVIALATAEALNARGYTVIYTAHRAGLVSQFADRVRSSRAPHQIRAGNAKPYDGSPLILSAVQSLATWQELPGLLRSRKCAILWDEWHETFYWDSLVPSIIGIPVKHIGLTATPWRLDGAEPWNGKPQWFECASYLDLVRSGDLIPIEYRCVVSKPAFATIRNRELTAAEKKAAIKQFTPERVFKIWGMNGGQEGIPTLGFIDSITGATRFAEYFRSQGVSSVAISSKSSTKERKSATDAFKQNRLSVLFSPEILRIGFDAPNVLMGLDLNATNALDEYIQAIGRLSRPDPNNPNKKYALWVDFVGGILRFKGQLPEQIKSWEEIERPIGRICLKCSLSNKKSAENCIRCGAALPRGQAPMRGNSSLEAEKIKVRHAIARIIPPGDSDDPVDQCRYELAVAFATGYSPAMAIQKVKQRNGGRMPQIRQGALLSSIFIEPTRDAVEIYQQHLQGFLRDDLVRFYLELEFGKI